MVSTARSAIWLLAVSAGCSASGGPTTSQGAIGARENGERTKVELAAPAMPKPDRRGGTAALLENRGCEGCHVDVAAEHRGSMHRRSYEDPAYQRAFAI